MRRGAIPARVTSRRQKAAYRGFLRLLQNPASWPWSPRCQRPFRAGSRYPKRRLPSLEPAMPAPVSGGFAVSQETSALPGARDASARFGRVRGIPAVGKTPPASLEPAMPSPFRAGSRYPRRRKPRQGRCGTPAPVCLPPGKRNNLCNKDGPRYSAPKGRYIPAQGNALGPCPPRGLSPEGADHATSA